MYIYIFTFSPVYVAGPTEETVVKFWQMVWEYQLNTIVMLTRCVEDNKVYTPAIANCTFLSSYCYVIELSQSTFSNLSLLIGQSSLSS